MKNLSISRIMISLIAVFTAVSPFAADFNETHVYNPAWPPHAKFHNGQTMTFGFVLGILAMYFLWLRKASTPLENLKLATIFSSLYWVAMAPAILFPGAAFTDPGQPTMPFNQVEMDFVILVILGLSYFFERKLINRKNLKGI